MFIFFNKANKLRGASHSDKIQKMKLFSFYFIGPAFYATVKATTENGTSEKTIKVRVKIALIAIATESENFESSFF